MISPLSNPILSAKGTVASIITAEIAPEISPKVSTVFFMRIQSPCRNLCYTPRFCGDLAVLSSFLRVIFTCGSQNHAFGRPWSGDQSGFLAELYRLGAPPGSELVEHAAGVGLHRVFADEQLVCDLTITESRRDQAENLQLPRR